MTKHFSIFFFWRTDRKRTSNSNLLLCNFFHFLLPVSLLRHEPFSSYFTVFPADKILTDGWSLTLSAKKYNKWSQLLCHKLSEARSVQSDSESDRLLRQLKSSLKAPPQLCYWNLLAVPNSAPLKEGGSACRHRGRGPLKSGLRRELVLLFWEQMAEAVRQRKNPIKEWKKSFGFGIVSGGKKKKGLKENGCDLRRHALKVPYEEDRVTPHTKPSCRGEICDSWL